MFTTDTILVTGATGKQGGAVARALLRSGHVVRALTRNPDSPAARALRMLGAEIFVGDLTDRASLDRALAGAETVFGMSTPFEGGMQAEILQGRTIADAAKAAGAHLVYTSVASAHRSTAIPHFDSKRTVEQHIEDIGVSATIIRPAYFMENLVNFGLAQLREGKLAMPLRPDTMLQQIAVSDIGAFAALVIEQRERFRGKAIDIASDEITGEEAAGIISRAAGRTISYVQTPLEAIRATSDDAATMYEWFDRVGYDVDIPTLRGQYTVVPWHSYGAWAWEQNWNDLLSPSQRKVA